MHLTVLSAASCVGSPTPPLVPAFPLSSLGAGEVRFSWLAVKSTRIVTRLFRHELTSINGF